MTLSTRKKIIFTVIYIVGLVLFVEVTARVTWTMLDKTWGLVVPQEVMRFDDQLGWAPQAGAVAVSKATGKTVEYAINDKGLRDGPTEYAKPDGVFRIVTLGDSHTFGFGVSLAEHYTTLLEGYFQHVEVVNLGVNGYGLDQMLLRLQSEGLRYKPDLVLLYLPHYGDVRHMRDKVWGMGKPRFELENGELIIKNSPVANNSRLYMTLIDTDRLVARYSRAYRMLRDALLFFRSKLAAADKAHSETSSKHISTPTQEQIDAMKKVNDLGVAIVKKIHDTAAENGAAFVLFTRVGNLFIDSFFEGILADYVADPLANNYMEITNDPTKHPNAAANAVLAWSMADYLTTKGLIPKSCLNTP
ncbi:SGNH/GDSL hydrolase family protein [Desulfovibrio inopinatus]|uniref:SGNH/GDSL hydrolase family protein n=1 Tax=Desulfovibrio inopinatus TaxID=102109 RepID=UPI00040381EF|nr:hypothetical protein [Desulfovibrio inopinatus]